MDGATASRGFEQRLQTIGPDCRAAVNPAAARRAAGYHEIVAAHPFRTNAGIACRYVGCCRSPRCQCVECGRVDAERLEGDGQLGNVEYALKPRELGELSCQSVEVARKLCGGKLGIRRGLPDARQPFFGSLHLLR